MNTYRIEAGSYEYYYVEANSMVEGKGKVEEHIKNRKELMDEDGSLISRGENAKINFRSIERCGEVIINRLKPGNWYRTECGSYSNRAIVKATDEDEAAELSEAYLNHRDGVELLAKAIATINAADTDPITQPELTHMYKVTRVEIIKDTMLI
jgi:hypothetical protein